MNPLLDVLRKAEAGRLIPEAPPPLRMELEPLNDATPQATAAAHARQDPDGRPPIADTRPPSLPTTESHTPRPNLPVRPVWQLAAGAALITGLITAIWLSPTPTSTALAQTHIPPAPSQPPEQARQPASPFFEPAPVAPTPTLRVRAPDALPQAAPRAPIAPPDEPVRFRRGSETAAPHLVATRAHDAYTVGDLPLARALYSQALAADPQDIDALDGLGAIALREGRPTEAEAWFQRALAASPHDPVALAGLSRLQAADPLQTESRLKNSLATRPDAPEALAPRLALADILARQQRWAEAQQAWFDAHRLAPDDPDIAYNLAVSLDRLGQTRPAAGFYRQALQLAERQPARFSRELCETRLNTLQATEPPP